MDFIQGGLQTGGSQIFAMLMINFDKTKVIMANDGIASCILIQNEQVDVFLYLGSLKMVGYRRW